MEKKYKPICLLLNNEKNCTHPEWDNILSRLQKFGIDPTKLNFAVCPFSKEMNYERCNEYISLYHEK
jgi:hypothetical protein